MNALSFVVDAFVNHVHSALWAALCYKPLFIGQMVVFLEPWRTSSSPDPATIGLGYTRHGWGLH